jgi:transcriptional regulator of arginine metabolism
MKRYNIHSLHTYEDTPAVSHPRSRRTPGRAQPGRAAPATLSRDIKELGLVKRASDGAYQAPGADGGTPAAAVVSLARALGEFLLSVEVSQQLLVMKTGPGQAQLLGVAVDRARFADIIGTIAGDDTVLVICRDARAAQNVRRTFEELAGER